VVVGGPCDALRAGIGVTVNLLGHRLSVTTNNCTILFGLLFTHLRRSQVIECDVYVRPPLLMIVYVQLFWSAVLC